MRPNLFTAPFSARNRGRWTRSAACARKPTSACAKALERHHGPSAGLNLDAHDYYGEAPFWWPDPANPAAPWVRKEGHVNPDRFVANKTALNATCDSIFTLGAASFFLDDPRYGRHAAQLINAWFLTPKTRMNPSLEYSQAIRGVNEARGGSIDGRVFSSRRAGMEFLAQSGQWDAKERRHAQMVRGLPALAHAQQDRSDEKTSGNLRASWWTAQVAAIATFLDDKAAGQMAFNYYRDSVFPRQVGAEAITPRERGAQPLARLFRIQRRRDGHYLPHRPGAGRGPVERAGQGRRHAGDRGRLPGASSGRPEKMGQGADRRVRTDGIYFLAFAGMGMKKPEYVTLYHQLEHPDSAWLSFVDLMAGRWEAAAHQTRH